MNAVLPEPRRNVFFKKKPVKIIAICLVAVLAIAGVYTFIKAKNNSSGGAVEQRTALAVKGELTDSITGSAPVVSTNRSELSPKAAATLEKVTCKEGDQVKTGDVLFVLDNTDALLNIENTRNSIAQLQLNIDSTAKSAGGLLVRAPYGGQITNISFREGDIINKGGALLTITDVDNLKVTLPFSGAAVKNISAGQKAVVYLQDLMLSVEGRIAYKSNKPYTTASGGELYDVEIAITNPGSLKEGMKATAEITAGGTILESAGVGTLSCINKKVMKSDAGGAAASLKVRENEFVNAGDILAELENDDLLLTSTTNSIKMESLQNQLDIQKKQLSYYTIVTPFDGTVTKLGSANEGDTVKQGELLAVVSDMGHLEFTVSIDELDVSQVAVGQTVKITAAALEETTAAPLTGKVSRIAMEGTSSNGVTTYPVTVTVDDNGAVKLKTGMNIDAEIIIATKPDALMIPLEAVTKVRNKSFVYLKGTAAEGKITKGSQLQGSAAQNQPAKSNSSGAQGRRIRAQGGPMSGTSAGALQGGFAGAAGRLGGGIDDYYQGAILTEVKTGISNDNYIEILSGLTEGQEIVLPKQNAGSSTGSSTGSGGFQRIQGSMIGDVRTYSIPPGRQ